MLLIFSFFIYLFFFWEERESFKELNSKKLSHFGNSTEILSALITLPNVEVKQRSSDKSDVTSVIKLHRHYD